MTEPRGRLTPGLTAVRSGVAVNAALALVKGAAGLVGHSAALVADAVESLADIVGSVVVWSGLRVSAQDPDHDHPWGHGKAEPMAAALVGLMLLGASVAILITAAQGIVVSNGVPAAWTLIVIALVVVVKELWFRRMARLADQLDSPAVEADAWHHRSDAISSGAAFLGVGLAVLGGEQFYWADEAAAAIAAGLIGFAGWRILRLASHELMDGAPAAGLLDTADRAARSVAGVCMIEKLMARKVGSRYFIDLHVQADPLLSLHDAHVLSGKVKTAIRDALPAVDNVLIHMEPFEGDTQP